MTTRHAEINFTRLLGIISRLALILAFVLTVLFPATSRVIRAAPNTTSSIPNPPLPSPWPQTDSTTEDNHFPNALPVPSPVMPPQLATSPAQAPMEPSISPRVEDSGESDKHPQVVSWAVERDRSVVYSVDDGGNRTKVADEPFGKMLLPQFGAFVTRSPDARTITYLTADNEMLSNARLWLVDADGSNRRLLAAFTEDLWIAPPVWSPDSTRLAFARPIRPPSRPGIELWLIDVSSGKQTRVSNTPGLTPGLFYGANPPVMRWTERGIEYTDYRTLPGQKITYTLDLDDDTASQHTTELPPDEQAVIITADLPCGVSQFSQNDPQWSGIVMQTCGITIGAAGCALTSVAMNFRYFDVNTSPSTLNSCLGTSACPIYWDTAASNCSEGKASFQGSPGFSWSTVESNLSAGRPVIVQLNGGNGHYVVVVSGSGSSGSGYTINDPWDGQVKSLAAYTDNGWTPTGLRIYGGTPWCQQDPPCPDSGGVILYKHANYDCGGAGEGSGYVLRSETGWQNVPDSFNDQASSIRVPSGWSVRLFEHSDRNGASVCRNGDDNDFGGDVFDGGSVPLNDQISSFQVFDNDNCSSVPQYPVTLYEHPDYNGNWCALTSEGWANVCAGFNDVASSIRLQPGWSARLFEHGDRGGSSACFTSDDANFSDNTFENGSPLDNQVSSFEAYHQSSCPPLGTPPDPPTLSSPANSTTLPQDTDITLDWNSSSGATEYYAHLWGDHSIDINSGWIGGTDWHIGQLWPGTYQWQVKARNGYGESDWSPTWSLSVQSDITSVHIEYVSDHIVQPGQVFSPTVIVRVADGYLDPLRGDHLVHTAGNDFGAWPVQPVNTYTSAGSHYWFDVNNDPSFTMTAPSSEGDHTSTWRVWADGDYASGDAVIPITVDGTPPVLTITEPLDGSAHNTDVITVEVDATDDRTGISQVEFFAGYDDGTGWDWHPQWDLDGSDGWSRSWNFSGVSDQHIAFLAYAWDNAWNGAWAPGIGITLDRDAPSSAVDPLAATQGNTTFLVTWSGNDNLSGIAGYDVQYRDGAGGAWTDWLVGTAVTSDSFTGQHGHTYYFRSRARDNADNWESYPTNPDYDTYTTVNSDHTISGHVRDASGIGIAGVTVGFSGARPAVTTDGSGYYIQSGFSAGNYTVTLSLSRHAFSPVIDQVTVNGGDVTHDAIGYPFNTASLPFSDGFESGGLGSAWAVETDYEGRVRIDSTYPYTGSHSLLLDDQTDAGFYSHAAAILALDLSGQSQIEMSFWWREFGDENNADDGVFISDDYGVTWYRAFSFNDGPATFTHSIVDLDAGASAAGMSLNNHFLVKFQFYDDYSIGLDGYAIDDVQVYASDTQPPTGSILINNGAIYTNDRTVNLDLSATDNVGVTEMSLHYNDGWQGWEPYANSRPATLIGGDGLQQTAVKYRDAAGNVSEPYSDTIILDLSPPNSSVDPLPLSQPSASFTVSWSGQDLTSGVAAYDVQVREDGGSWSDWIRGTMQMTGTFAGAHERTYCFRSRAHDHAGNLENYPGDDGDTCTTTDTLSTTTVVKLNPVTASTSTGVPVTFTVAISDVDDLGSFQFNLVYDSALVQVEEVALGEFLGSTGRAINTVGPIISNTTGMVTFGAFSLGSAPSGPSGDGPLAYVRFVPQNTGMATLRFQDAQASEVSGESIPLLTQSATLSIVACVGDFDDDGDVDIIDVQMIAYRWNSRCGDPLYDPIYDLDGDCDIDILDIQQVAYRWGTQCSGLNKLASEPWAPQQESTLSIFPPSRTAQVGQTFTLSVVITEAVDLGAFEFTMTYSPTVIEVVSMEVGDFPGSTGRTFSPVGPVVDAANGTVTFGAYSLGAFPAGPDGDGTLAVFTLRALAVGESSLEFSSAQVSDRAGTPLVTGHTSGGRVQVQTDGFTYSLFLPVIVGND